MIVPRKRPSWATRSSFTRGLENCSRACASVVLAGVGRGSNIIASRTAGPASLRGRWSVGMDGSLARVVCHDRRVIVEWGLGELPGVLARLGIERPLVVTDEVFADVELPGTERRFHGAQPHADLKGVRAALEVAGDADGLVALGGGSVIDTTKAVSKELDVPIVSVPTTYAGAEWTHWYGNRDSETRTKPAGLDARVEGIVYEVDLTMGAAPRAQRRHGAQRADPCGRGALRVGADDRHRRAGARRHAQDLLRAPARHAGRLRPGGATRAAAGCRTRGRRDARGHGRGARDRAGPRRPLRPAARDDERHRPAAGPALQPRGRRRPPPRSTHSPTRSAPTTPPRASRSSRRCSAPAGCATMASRRRTCPRSPSSAPHVQRRRPTRGP